MIHVRSVDDDEVDDDDDDDDRIAAYYFERQTCSRIAISFVRIREILVGYGYPISIHGIHAGDPGHNILITSQFISIISPPVIFQYDSDFSKFYPK